MEYEIETAHGRLFCRREGSGPILLLIHGVACDSEFFRETSKLLAETFTVISYDRRGYSRSIAAEGENDFSGRMRKMRQRSFGWSRNGRLKTGSAR